jgi:DNA-binding transcriptional MerR regulator
MLAAAWESSVKHSDHYLTASDAARQLGVSPKALRLYEERRLLAPLRTAAGWRAYGPDQMNRAAEIVALRALGFGLAQVARVLGSGSERLEDALASQQAQLELRSEQLATAISRVRAMRRGLSQDRPRASRAALRVTDQGSEPSFAFDLPWPWGGERFELGRICPIMYITGPLGSGKTRLARRVAATLPDAVWLGLERLSHETSPESARLEADKKSSKRIQKVLAGLSEKGASHSRALVALVTNLEADGLGPVVVDMIEQELDEKTQRAVMTYLRERGSDARPCFLLTRSCAILDLEAITADEAIIYCPANHSPPMHVNPHPGSRGYELVVNCLAAPAVRARIAIVPDALWSQIDALGGAALFPDGPPADPPR